MNGSSSAVPSLPTPRQVWTAGGGSCPSESRTNGGSRAADQHVLKVGKKKSTVHSEEDADGERKSSLLETTLCQKCSK